ncbi:MAG: UvrD-helicase domain-containing protein, partial [Acidimicrobiales bacterium]
AVRELDALTELCTDPADKLAIRISDFVAWAEQLSDDLDLYERVRVLSDRPSTGALRIGAVGNWSVSVSEIREQGVAVGALIDAALVRLKDSTIEALASRVRRFALDSAELRRSTGRVTFDDLLVLARDLLRNSPSARTALQNHYQRLLIDEFQDTDPIQVELAVLLGSLDPPGHWQGMELDPGRLFFVGDPKQSIYRFRRADIHMYLKAADTIDTDGHVQLSTNFRSSEPIIDWLNGVFEELIDPQDAGQSHYEALAAGPRESALAGAPVTLLGATELPDANVLELREAEANEVAYAIQAILHDKWQVDVGGVRPAVASDITILLPDRKSVGALERALGSAGIPFRTDSIGNVYRTSEVRDLMATLRAIDDPNDELSIVTALRSPIYGCGDDELYQYASATHSAWNYQEFANTSPPGLVLDGLTHMSELHQLRQHTSPDQLIARVLSDRRCFEAAFAHRRPRDTWRRYRFILDQARAFAETEAGDLRRFLAWVNIHSSEQSNVSETVIPETDEDAVRIMTIHSCKGLEFPIVICSGLATAKSKSIQV